MFANTGVFMVRTLQRAFDVHHGDAREARYLGDPADKLDDDVRHEHADAFRDAQAATCRGPPRRSRPRTRTMMMLLMYGWLGADNTGRKPRKPAGGRAVSATNGCNKQEAFPLEVLHSHLEFVSFDCRDSWLGCRRR
jgi:hypothetical protein